MKILHALALMAISLVFAVSPAAATSQTVGIDEEYVGTLPATAGNSGGSQQGQSASSKRYKVTPGNSHKNGDTVSITNDKDSNGNAYINPKHGNSASETTVDTLSGFEGTVGGTDSNDTVNIGSNNTATVNTEGGTVNIGGGSTVTVTTSPTGGTTTINMNSGQSITLPPGSTNIVFTT